MVKQAGLIGLSRLGEDLGLRVPLSAVRSEVVQGARRGKISGASILEQYPLSYARPDLFGQHRFATRGLEGIVGTRFLRRHARTGIPNLGNPKFPCELLSLDRYFLLF